MAKQKIKIHKASEIKKRKKPVVKIVTSEEKFNNKLKRLSGLSKEVMAMAEKHENFRSIQEALAEIYDGKGVLYGDYISTRAQEPKNFALLSLFFDIKRKYVRFENIAKLLAKGTKIQNDEIIDTVSDIAVYGVMGLLLMKHFDEKGE